MLSTSADMLASVSRSRMLLAAFFVLALACCARAPSSVADRARSIEGQVWSPYCPGRLLIDCTTPQARELRAQIQRRVARGQSPDEVLRWIRGDFGDEVLARPGSNGTGLAIWLVPAAVFAAGAILLGGLVRRWTHARAEPAPTRSPPADESRSPQDVVRRVREEVERDL
jgi:cytochrome c-type biogenesis protein CcmH/NrfF